MKPSTEWLIREMERFPVVYTEAININFTGLYFVTNFTLSHELCITKYDTLIHHRLHSRGKKRCEKERGKWGLAAYLKQEHAVEVGEKDQLATFASAIIPDILHAKI